MTSLVNIKSKAIEIIKGRTLIYLDRLFWISDSSPPKNLTKAFYFNIDDVNLRWFQDLEYEPFYLDFGPLNLGKMWKYVTELEKLLGHQ